MDSREYLIEFPDGDEEKYAANVIAENLYLQADSEGRQYAVMKAMLITVRMQWRFQRMMAL